MTTFNNMTEETKRELYEQIMNEISAALKKMLLESTDKSINVNDEIDDIEYINSIPYEIRKDVQEDLFSYIFEGMDDTNPISKYTPDNSFDPNIIYTAGEVVDFMTSKYGEKYEHFFRIKEKYHKIECVIYLPKDKRLNKSVKESMEKLNWFVATSEDITDESGYIWRAYHFEPFNQKNEASNIRKYPYLYHITPLIWLESILKEGIIKKSSSVYTPGSFAYPKRVYLVEGSHKKENLDKIAMMLYKNRRRVNRLTPSKYAILTLDVSAIPETTQMYYDPNYRYGVFVQEDVPANVIIDVKIYDCDKEKYIIYGKWDKLKSKLMSLFNFHK